MRGQKNREEHKKSRWDYESISKEFDSNEVAVRLRRSDVIRGFLFLAKSNIAGNVGAVGSQQAIDIDGHLPAELADHGTELGVVRYVFVPLMQADKVLALQQAPAGFLAVERAAVRGLKQDIEAG